MLITRCLTALLLMASMLIGLFILPTTFGYALVVLVLAIAAWEWAALLHFNRVESIFFLSVFLGLTIFYGYNPTAFDAVMLFGNNIVVLFWCLLVPLWLRYQWPLRAKYCAGGFALFILFTSLVATLQWYQRGAAILLALFAVAWVADSSAYFIGRIWGKHKLALTISPGKTWEGVFGAMFGVGIYSLILAACWPEIFVLPWWLCLLVAWGLAATAIIGDLFESLLKRQRGCKDSGTLLPGHGGVLDRIDSLLAMVPVASALVLPLCQNQFWLRGG